MSQNTFEQSIRKSIQDLEQGDSITALIQLEEAARENPTPLVCSYLAYCLAREKGDMQRAVGLCFEAIRREPARSLHYLNLGRVYLEVGQKPRAIQTFRKGLKLEKNQKIIGELKRIGLRKRPVFPSMDRDHFLNKYFGILFHRLGLR